MELILGPIVGAVTQNKAKVWIFGDKTYDEKIPQCHVFKDKACSEEIPESPFKFQIISSSEHIWEGIHGLAGLADISFPAGMEKLYYKIRTGSSHDEENDRIYCIQPFPEAGVDVDTFSFALISCHKPLFKNPRKDSKMVGLIWHRLSDEMRKHNCCFLIQAGDQVYSDHKRFNAWKWSQQTDSEEKMLRYYRQIYLKSWKFPEVHEVMRTFPQYMIWDDHEITNGWGSEEKHSQPKCQEIFKIARQAYIEFQHCYNPDSLREGEFYYAFSYGPACFLFMDLRGHRDITRYKPDKPDSTYPLAGENQWQDIIEAWFNSDIVRKSKMLFVITSVPVCHLSRKFGSLGIFKNDVNDQWSTPHNTRERRKLLKLLYKWSGESKKPVCILGGDAHVGTVADITNCRLQNTIYQITSSPITNKPAYLLDFFLAIFSKKFDFHLDSAHKERISAKITRRYRRRNFAIIKVNFTAQKPKVDVYMYEQGRMEPDIKSLC